MSDWAIQLVGSVSNAMTRINADFFMFVLFISKSGGKVRNYFPDLIDCLMIIFTHVFHILTHNYMIFINICMRQLFYTLFTRHLVCIRLTTW